MKRPNLVRCADITDLPMRRGSLYLVAIMDRHTRKVLAWRLRRRRREWRFRRILCELNCQDRFLAM